MIFPLDNRRHVLWRSILAKNMVGAGRIIMPNGSSCHTGCRLFSGHKLSDSCLLLVVLWRPPFLALTSTKNYTIFIILSTFKLPPYFRNFLKFPQYFCSIYVCLLPPILTMMHHLCVMLYNPWLSPRVEFAFHTSSLSHPTAANSKSYPSCHQPRSNGIWDDNLWACSRLRTSAVVITWAKGSWTTLNCYDLYDLPP